MSADSSEALLMPYQKETGQSTRDFKRLQTNKRRKLHNTKPHKMELPRIRIPPSTDMSSENTGITQGSRASANQPEIYDEQETSSTERTWIISEGIGGRCIDADPLMTRDEQ
jgi:hypothetical protein